ncbi:MAG: hypothetical protein LBE12_12670 [Planctomycetaceae bacterium]|nr:hypothetical protein [Planctomycetaceae bacterium]
MRNVAPTLVISGAFVQERYKDRWTNIKLSQPKPGQFFNRRSCSWYWNSKRKDVTLLQGLIAFAKEDYETAEKHWNLLAELDKEFYAQQKESGWENVTTLARLTWNLRNQKGSLYATPEEMASFKDPKRRMAILIADLYYESEQHQKALSIYQRLENRELGTPSKNELAYVMFATFACLCWMPSIDEITYIESRAKNFNGTPSESRVIMGYANRICVENDSKRLLKGLQYYALLSKYSLVLLDKEFASFMVGKIYERLADNVIYLQNPVLALKYYQNAIKHYQELLANKKANLYHKAIKANIVILNKKINNQKN